MKLKSPISLSLLCLVTSLMACDGPWVLPVDLDGDGYSVEQGDCNNTDNTVYPGAIELCDGLDNDCDGKSDADDDDDGYLACQACPEGILCGDCDDENPQTHPNAPEICDFLDNDCDGFGDSDADNDGHCTFLDCDDDNATIHPSAPEICDGLDNDCDGETEDPLADADQDGYSVCGLEEGDCNDQNPQIHPGASESCNNLDDDCNGLTDDPQSAFDQDGDLTSDCIDNDLDGFTELQGDCADLNALTHPQSPEFFDGQDNDCDGKIDESLSEVDFDGDGYSSATGDCNDNQDSIHPNAPEICNFADEDCDLAIDENVAQLWYADKDQDGYGTGIGWVSCTSPGPAYSPLPGDCNDGNASIHPAAPETCDAIDNNCNGETDEWPDEGVIYYWDEDGDGFGLTDSTVVSGCEIPTGFAPFGEDCDDTNPDINPGHPEFCADATDNDCDGWIDETLEDQRLMTPLDAEESIRWENDHMQFRIFALAALLGSAPLLNTATDGCCEEQTYYADKDGDGYGDPNESLQACDMPAGYVEDSSDCNDLDPEINPGAEPIECDGIDNSCEALLDIGWIDCPVYPDLCQETGGEWLDCGSGCGPATCDNPVPGDICPDVCIAQCACPEDTPYWDDDLGCVSRDECAGAVDKDEDGYPADVDCDDSDPTIHPDQEEPCECDGIDQNCNGIIDDFPCDIACPDDADGDGYGEPADCDDTNPRVYPGAPEVCDEIDNNCDGTVDENCTDEETIALCHETHGEWDLCGSGCGPATCDNPEPGDICPDVCIAQCSCPADAPFWDEEEGCVSREACSDPVDADGDGFPAGEDCNDRDPNINPRAEEVCDGVDNDCDRIVDEGCEDNDILLCEETGGDWTTCGTCNAPTCDIPVDEICTEECKRKCECPEDAPYWDENLGCIAEELCDERPDQDMDGYPVGEDCNDLDPEIHPDRGEECSCDGIDEDCNGVVDDFDCQIACPVYEDADGDGYAGNIDCDDQNPRVNPGTYEVCGDRIDNDCDGILEEGCTDHPVDSQLCESTGGEWALGCTPKTCEDPCGYECADCFEAVPHCFCPEWAERWDEEVGCIPATACETGK